MTTHPPTSVECHHGHHAFCKATCQFCDERCTCACHRPEDPWGACAACGYVVALKPDGTLADHAYRSAYPLLCEGSGKPAWKYR